MSNRPEWRLPSGVHRGSWDYIQSPSIATDYDGYFRSHAMFELDRRFVLERLAATFGGEAEGGGRVVVDLGCGTGRFSQVLVPRGYRVVNIDLSPHMLRQAQQKLATSVAGAVFLRGNMAELDFLSDQSADAILCMFSSLGMLRGRANRRRCLRHCHRILKDGGILLLHVHHLWRDLREPGGWGRLASAAWSAIRDRRCELGDTVYVYRNLPSMFMHRFRRSELIVDLRHAGFPMPRLTPIDVRADRLLPGGRWLSYSRAGGFFAEAIRR
ncbi:MAG: class I SAM-dependent methyltransferase [Planctomycetota bacterium]|nr:MAG: class I SAM-dependent methyltransferase [Planctomycetota bacterium]